MTPAENRLWLKLRLRQFQNLKFRRQHGIGPYIVDFFCPEIKMVIEVDGDVHTIEKQIIKDFLWLAKIRIVEYLEQLMLTLHENKYRLYKTNCGVPFLGLLIFPNRRRLKRANIVRFKKRLKWFQKLYGNDSKTWLQICRSVRSWIGHAVHANTMQLRKLVLEDVVFRTWKGN